LGAAKSAHLRANDPRGVNIKEHHLLFCTIILLRLCILQISLSAIELKIASINYQTKRADLFLISARQYSITSYHVNLKIGSADPDISFEPAASF
jgi:hypothetical protein